MTHQIKVSDRTWNQLLKLGKMGDSMESVILRLLDKNATPHKLKHTKALKKPKTPKKPLVA
jgi:predicted CopG family antitoxin